MVEKNQHPTAGRTETDDSLRSERATTDHQLAESRARIDEDADLAVERARNEADETLRSTRSKADARLERAGATSEVRASARAEQETVDLAHDRERRSADSGLDAERAQGRRAIAALLDKERHQTDLHLLLERACSDDAFDRILAELSKTVRLREEFISVASHELKTPLTPLALRLDSLAREAAKQPDSLFAAHVRSYIEAAGRQVRKLAALVAGLLDVSRIVAGELRLELEPVDLGALVRDLESRYRPEAARAGCALEVDAPRVLGRWNELRLERAVASLLENAIRYGAGRPIRVRLQADSERARLTVQDWGIGIDPDQLSRIFGRFERAVSERNYGGLGLGLYVCRAVIEAMGGTVSAESELGRGSTFTVELPLAGPKLQADLPDEAEHPPEAREKGT